MGVVKDLEHGDARGNGVPLHRVGAAYQTKSNIWIVIVRLELCGKS